MKNLHIISILFLSLIVLSCNNDDDNSNSNPAGDEGFQATINGDTYSNYSFVLAIYQITKGTNSNNLSIDVGDTNGDMVNLFLNETGGFSSGTTKQMGNIDSNNFTTHAVIRQQETEITYFSSSGSVTITNNRTHPTNEGHRLISGNFDITASTINGTNSITISGSFSELEYVD